MQAILAALGAQLGGDSIRNLSGQIGAPAAQTATAVSAALPMLLAGLGRQASQAGGADKLMSMLDRDGDGSILDDVAGFFAGGGRGAGASGSGPLAEIFGQRADSVGGAVSRASGLGGAQVTQLLALLVPVVLSFLARGRSGAGSGGGGLGDLLGGLLGGGAGAPPPGGGLGDLVGGLLGGGGGAGDRPGPGGGGLGDLLGSALGGGAPAAAGAAPTGRGNGGGLGSLLDDDSGLDELAAQGASILGGLLRG